ncbi:MAG: DUF1788 domain-containing protein [Bacteroidia bacterium]|nr:DUF1788 domain-containing protein [Bacteroidia bacterium]
MENLVAKFAHHYNVISSERFLKREALGGEIPFFISAYNPENELEVRRSIKMLIKKLDTSGVRVLELNLYDLVCEILQQKGGMERMFLIEQKKGKDKFLKALQSTLNIHEVLMPHIAGKIKDADAQVYFLTGVGLVYPYIRSHNILNNLQSIAIEAPTVCYFPGEYDGHTLKLFGKLKDDNYYRAFNIDKIDPK